MQEEPDRRRRRHGAADQFQYDHEAGQETTFDGETGDAFSADFTWTPAAEGEVASYVSEPLQDTISPSWARPGLICSSRPPQRTPTSRSRSASPPRRHRGVRPSGLAHASHRALDEAGRPRSNRSTHTESDADPLEPGEYTEVPVEALPVRLRVPGRFPAAHHHRLAAELPVLEVRLGGQRGGVVNRIAHSEGRPSAITPSRGLGRRAPLPSPPARACAQPCTDYQAVENQPAEGEMDLSERRVLVTGSSREIGGRRPGASPRRVRSSSWSPATPTPWRTSPGARRHGPQPI